VEMYTSKEIAVRAKNDNDNKQEEILCQINAPTIMDDCQSKLPIHVIKNRFREHNKIAHQFDYHGFK